MIAGHLLMIPDIDAIARLVDDARTRGDGALVGAEAMQVAAAIGVRCPPALPLRGPADVPTADRTPLGDRVVIKAISPRIVHKTDLAAVAIVDNDAERVAAAVADMARRLAAYEPAFLLTAYVPHDRAFGDELILGARWTPEFGPVVSMGAGGTATEFLAANLRADRSLAHVSPVLRLPRPLGDLLRESAAVEMATTPFRGGSARVPLAALEAAVAHAGEAARRFGELGIAEFEVNPLVVSNGELIALDARVILGRPPAAAPPRPIRKLERLLVPGRVAIAGVSADMNPGRIIVRNLLREGFDPARITIVKRDADEIDGCRCVPTLAAMPHAVDLLVLSVPAAAAASLIVEAVRERRAESVIVIPGGFEEKSGGGAIAADVRSALDAARATAWGGPVVNGGNCIGVRSKPGRYDTTFIPEDRLPLGAGPASPVAMIAQSGAFVLTLLAKCPALNPKYVVTVGNQIDLTIADYLSYLKHDRSVDVFAAYVEGFKPLDGAAFVEAAADIASSGRTVILYRGGRTAAGARATSSHTASMAGDYDVTRALARQAGVVVADTLEDFEDLVKLFAMLRERHVGGWRLAAMSNAGFECVAMADHLGRFELAPLTRPTLERLHELVKSARADGLVDVHNPLDVTPMTGDVAYAQIAGALLNDDTVDVGAIACVPMTPALATVASRQFGGAPFAAESIVTLLTGVNRDIRKAWVGVVDAGQLYDPMVARLEAAGIPTFRAADRALRLFEIFCRERLRRNAKVQHPEDEHEDTMGGALRSAHAGHAAVGGS